MHRTVVHSLQSFSVHCACDIGALFSGHLSHLRFAPAITTVTISTRVRSGSILPWLNWLSPAFWVWFKVGHFLLPFHSVHSPIPIPWSIFLNKLHWSPSLQLCFLETPKQRYCPTCCHKVKQLSLGTDISLSMDYWHQMHQATLLKTKSWHWPVIEATSVLEIRP